VARQFYAKPIDILLVEDNPADVRLTREALVAGKVLNRLSVVSDGLEALAFLRHEGQYGKSPRPDLILLDLNMPHMDGRDLLRIVKTDPDFHFIPVVILTTSDAEQDILKSYDLHANSYITKPVDMEQFIRVVRSMEDFWFQIAKLPSR
jgi:CheY-like chemotaxis protein